MSGLIFLAAGLISLTLQGCGPPPPPTTTTTTLPPCIPETPTDECWTRCNTTCTADECQKLGPIGCEGAPCAPIGKKGACISKTTTTTTTTVTTTTVTTSTTGEHVSPEACMRHCKALKADGCCKYDESTECRWLYRSHINGAAVITKDAASANCRANGECDGWTWAKDCRGTALPIPPTATAEVCFQRCSKVRATGCCKLEGTACLWSPEAAVNGTSKTYNWAASANCYLTGVCDGWNWGTDCGGAFEPVPAPTPVPPAPAPSPPDPKQWKQVWSDNFDKCPDGRPDTKKWGYEIGYIRNKEKQYYQKDNAECVDGNLVITAKRETPPSGDGDYTSSSLTSENKSVFKHGRYEMRAKIPVDKGAWPAFWARGADTKLQWPSDGEVDIMEFYQDTVLANFVYGGRGNTQQWNSARFALPSKEWADEFHVWAMEWDAEEIRLLVDGQLVNSQKVAAADGVGHANPWREFNVYLMVNLAIGGTNGGDPSDTDFPLKFLVDYISVYQRVHDTTLVVT